MEHRRRTPSAGRRWAVHQIVSRYYGAWEPTERVGTWRERRGEAEADAERLRGDDYCRREDGDSGDLAVLEDGQHPRAEEADDDYGEPPDECDPMDDGAIGYELHGPSWPLRDNMATHAGEGE